jgi:hypothetical protein
MTALYLWERRNFVWWFEHMFLLVELVGDVNLCRWSILFHSERWEYLLLQFFVDRTSLIIRRTISSTQNTLDIMSSFFPVALVCGVVVCAFTNLGLSDKNSWCVHIFRHLAHWAIYLLCLGRSNVILDYCRYSTSWRFIFCWGLVSFQRTWEGVAHFWIA